MPDSIRKMETVRAMAHRLNVSVYGARASRMPEHMETLDPAFIAALRRPVPEEAKREKEEV